MNMKSIEEIENKILNGNCIEILRDIPDDTIDLIFADPPYFMQTEGELKRPEGTNFAGVDDEWDKFSNYDQYDKFCKKLTEKYDLVKIKYYIAPVGESDPEMYAEQQRFLEKLRRIDWITNLPKNGKILPKNGKV